MQYRIGEIEYPVTVIRKNNKNTYIRIKDGIIEVSTNYFVTQKQILSLLEKNKLSIQKMMNQCQHRQEKQQRFFYLGQSYDIIKMPIESVEIKNNYLYTKDEQQLNHWLINQMKNIFQERYQYWYQQYEENIPFYPLRFRKMKTRWGVCNRKSKTITLNTELIHYPYEAIDYVIIHELSHLIHFNHSVDFWKQVEKYCPNYKNIKKQLKE